MAERRERSSRSRGEDEETKLRQGKDGDQSLRFDANLSRLSSAQPRAARVSYCRPSSLCVCVDNSPLLFSFDAIPDSYTNQCRDCDVFFIAIAAESAPSASRRPRCTLRRHTLPPNSGRLGPVQRAVTLSLCSPKREKQDISLEEGRESSD